MSATIWDASPKINLLTKYYFLTTFAKSYNQKNEFTNKQTPGR